MISKRIQHMIPSATLEQSAKIAALKKQGVQIIGFNVGEPDFNTPINIVKKVEEAYRLGITQYTPAAGMLELREEICRKFREAYGVDYTPQEVIVSAGAKQSLTNAIMTIVDPGDEVVVLTPCWVSYLEMIKLAEGIPVLVPLEENEGFGLDVEKIRKNITTKTKAIIINSPNNPTGAVYSKQELEQLGQMAIEHDFYIISDEIYELLVYEEAQNICVASLSPAIREKTITINGMSKAYAMTGWRIGYALGPAPIIKGMTDYQGNTTTSPNTPAQYASMEALANSRESVEMMRAEFDRRRKYIIERINAMEHLSCSAPKGAFYVMPNVSHYFGSHHKGGVINNSQDLANYLLEEANIAVVTGAAFEAPDHIRISYSNSMENIEKGMNRLEEALSKLNP